MRIEQYLKRVRATLLRKQLLKFFLWAIMLVSIALFVMIQLESIFYFHPKIKILFILGLLGCVFVLTISETVYLWRAKKNNIYQYKVDNIAKNLGSKIYKGKVVKIMEFGAFVNFFGKKDGLVHISQLANERVNNVTDVVSEGDIVKVKLVGFDNRGKVKLSMKDVDQKTGKENGPKRR